jgi:hypothetical protein
MFLLLTLMSLFRVQVNLVFLQVMQRGRVAKSAQAGRGNLQRKAEQVKFRSSVRELGDDSQRYFTHVRVLPQSTESCPYL